MNKTNQTHTLHTYLEQCYDSKYSTDMNLLIDLNIVKTFMPYLNPHEQIIWTAKPNQGLSVRFSQLLYIPVALLWLLMCSAMFNDLFLASDTILSSNLIDILVSVLMSIIFIGVGLYMLFGHYVVDIIRRNHIVYAMSEQRIFIRSGVFSKELNVLHLEKLDTLRLKENRLSSSDRGSILLSKPPRFHWWQKKRGNLLAEIAGYDGIIKLEQIDKVKEVYKLISRFHFDLDIS